MDRRFGASCWTSADRIPTITLGTEQNLLKTSSRRCLHGAPRQSYRYRSVWRSSAAVQIAGRFLATSRPHCSAPPLLLNPTSCRRWSLCLRRSSLFHAPDRRQRRFPPAALLATEIV